MGFGLNADSSIDVGENLRLGVELLTQRRHQYFPDKDGVLMVDTITPTFEPQQLILDITTPTQNFTLPSIPINNIVYLTLNGLMESHFTIHDDQITLEDPALPGDQVGFMWFNYGTVA